jgi:hypothetical protein
MSERRFNRGGSSSGGRERGARRDRRGGGGGKGPASVGARFHNVESVRSFLIKLGMPDTLVKQLTYWLQDLRPDEAERMEPELTWEGQATALYMTALLDEEDGSLDVEFGGPASLVEALQADLDEFFRPKQEGRKK